MIFSTAPAEVVADVRKRKGIMQNRDIQAILQGLFNFSVLKKLQWYLIVIAAIASVIAIVAPRLVSGKGVVAANSSLFAGIILSMLLVFRTNSAYDRWWEGRRAWGQLVNDLRNLSIKYYEFVRPNLQEREIMAATLIRFAVAMKDHLRLLDSSHSRAPECDNPVSEHPMLIVEEIYSILDQKRREGRLNDMMFNVIDPHARALLDILEFVRAHCHIADYRIAQEHNSAHHRHLPALRRLFAGTRVWNVDGAGRACWCLYGARFRSCGRRERASFRHSR